MEAAGAGDSRWSSGGKKCAGKAAGRVKTGRCEPRLVTRFGLLGPKRKFPLAFRHAARPRHQTTKACKFSIYLLTRSICLIDSLEFLQR